MNPKVFIKRIKRGRLKTAPHHYSNEHTQRLNVIKNENLEKEFGNQMYEYGFFEEFIINTENHLPTPFMDYALNYEIPNCQSTPKLRTLVLLTFLVVNSSKIDDSVWLGASYTEDYETDRMLNDYAYNYWKGTSIKYRKYIKQNFISVLVDDENDVKVMTKILELEKLLTMLITELLKNQNNEDVDAEHYSLAWFNVVDEHNDSLVNRK